MRQMSYLMSVLLISLMLVNEAVLAGNLIAHPGGEDTSSRTPNYGGFIYASPQVLYGFSYILGNGPSNSSYFTVSGWGTDYTQGIWIYGDAYYEVSTNNVDWTTQVFIPAGGGPPIWSYSGVAWVRLRAGINPYGQYNGMVSCNDFSNGIYTSVHCLGEVTNDPSNPSRFRWIGQSNASWQVSTNWSPPRSYKSRSNNDIIDFQFQGGNSVLTITDVPSEIIGQLNVQPPYNITLLPADTGSILSIKGIPDGSPSLNVYGGATLNLAGSNALSISLLTGTSGVINGNFVLNSGGTLTINPLSNVTVLGNFTNNNGNQGIIIKSNVTGTGSFITSVPMTGTMERYIPGDEWHLISSPVASAVSGLFTGCYLQNHSEATNVYTDITSTTEPLTPTKGFAVYKDEDITPQFSGNLNYGTQSMAVTNVTEGWNLVGNPYASYINWDATGWTKTNVNNAIYMHINSGFWASYVNGVGTNGGTNIIAPGQGFFIQASASGTLGMSNNVRTHSTGPFYKNSDSVLPNMVRLKLICKNNIDETIVRLAHEASAGFDGEWDAHKFFADNDTLAEIYSNGSLPLSVNSLAEPGAVPVGIRWKQGGICMISASDVNDLTNVFLEDKKTGNVTDLKKQPYAFTVEPGDDEQRFVLTFDLLSIYDKEREKIKIYSSGNAFYIDNSGAPGAGEYIVYNLAGQVILKGSLNAGHNEGLINIPGIYIVKVIMDQAVASEKVHIY